MFRKVLNKGANCAIVISCRDEGIAQACDERVPFDFLQPMGNVSKRILLSLVDGQQREDVLDWVEEKEECRRSFERVLKGMDFVSVNCWRKSKGRNRRLL